MGMSFHAIQRRERYCLLLASLRTSRFKALLAVNGFFDINRNLTLKVIHLA